MCVRVLVKKAGSGSWVKVAHFPPPSHGDVNSRRARQRLSRGAGQLAAPGSAVNVPASDHAS